MNVKKWSQSEICIVINDTSQGSIAKQLIMYGILLRQLFFVAVVMYSGPWDFFYVANVNNFLLVNEILLISPGIYFKPVFEWLSLA